MEHIVLQDEADIQQFDAQAWMLDSVVEESVAQIVANYRSHLVFSATCLLFPGIFLASQSRIFLLEHDSHPTELEAS